METIGSEPVNHKKTHQFSGLDRSPIFDPENRGTPLAAIYSRDNDYLFGPLLPLQLLNADSIKQDLEIPLRGGSTPAVALDSESPIWGQYRRADQEWAPAHYREKCVIKETDLVKLRKIGTESDLMTAKELAAKLYDPIVERQANMIEVSRRQALFDSVVTVNGPNDSPIQVKFPHPAYLNPSTAASWSNTATGDTLADLQLWLSQFIIDTSFDVQGVWLAHDQLRLTGAQTKFIARATAGGNVFDGSDGAVNRFITSFIG